MVFNKNSLFKRICRTSPDISKDFLRHQLLRGIKYWHEIDAAVKTLSQGTKNTTFWKSVQFYPQTRAGTSLIRDSLWFAFDSKSNQPIIREWLIHDSPTFDFWFDLILIRRWIMIRGWIKIRDESKSNRIKMNKINLNRKSKWIKIKMNCESKWINIRIKSNKYIFFSGLLKNFLGLKKVSNKILFTIWAWLIRRGQSG